MRLVNVIRVWGQAANLGITSMSTSLKVIAGLVALIITALLFSIYKQAWQPSPFYAGKRLDYWIAALENPADPDHKEACGVLERAMNSNELPVSRKACQALSNNPYERWRTIPYIFKLYVTDESFAANPEDTGILARNIEIFPPEASKNIPLLTEIICTYYSTSNSERAARVRSCAIYVLRNIGGGREDVILTLKAALKDPAPDVRSSAAFELGNSGVAAAPAIPALKGMAKTDIPLNREISLKAMIKLANVCAEVIPAIEEAVDDPDKDVRLTAQLGLEQIKNRKSKK